jgi:ubiquinone/menaquinone biosynthesis C-methylase UbiE
MAVIQTRHYEGNAEAIEAWNGVLFDKFARFRHILTSGFAACGHAALERHPPPRAGRVVDIGCGFGDTTQDIARLVGPEGEAVGVDAATRFIETARHDAATANVTNARFEVADAQLADLGGPYDQAFSRFGTMFFISPVAAFRNIRRSLTPGSPLVMVVWRKKEDNTWLWEAEQAVAEIVPRPPTTDQPTCGPGPFSMANADVVSSQLLAAGYDAIRFERFDASIRIGNDVPDALEFALALGPAGELLRLAGEEGMKRRPEVIAALSRILTPYARADGVFAPASTWIVSANAPA